MDINSLNNNQHLNSEELREYKQGNLSNKEMHRLELHMIDCELCSDALEGLSKLDASTFTSSVESIKSRTGAEQKFEINQKQWLAIAASFILLAVVSLVFYNWPGDAEDVLAMEQRNDEKPALSMAESDTQRFPPPDSATSEESGEDKLLASIEEQPVVKQKEEKSPSPAPVESTVDLDLAMTESDPEFILEEEIADDSTMANLAVAEEEPVQGSAARSKKASSSQKEGVRSESDDIVGDSFTPTEPQKGQRSYDRYLKRKLQYPENAKENNIEGEVIVQLTIDASGNISDVRVTKSLGYGCDEEAIRLIKEGPGWSAGKRNGVDVEDTISVRVSFKL